MCYIFEVPCERVRANCDARQLPQLEECSAHVLVLCRCYNREWYTLSFKIGAQQVAFIVWTMSDGVEEI